MEQNPKPNSLPKSINTIDDVWEFFNYLHIVDGVLFHPEGDFREFINWETDKPTYTAKEAKERNILMDKCFDVCSENDFNIFQIGLEAIKRNLNGDKSLESGKNKTNVAVCILSEDYVEEDTGLVFGFSINKSYPLCD